MTKRDYYEVLEISREASSDELKKAYKRLAMRYHPDQNQGDEQATEKFKELTEAYKVLSHPQQRSHYDRFGHEAPNMGFGNATVDVSSMTDFFESIFGTVFGGPARTRNRGHKPGRDLQYDLTISLEEAVRGAKVKITVPRPVRCAECHGSGAAKGTSPKTCSQCDGAGVVRLQQGIFTVKSTCPVCEGTGEVIHEHCKRCNSEGLEEKEEEFNISIPPGVDDGAVKVLQGGGEQGRGGASDGDLHVMVRVKKHDMFVRKGQELHNVIHVTYPQAVLGAQVEVSTVEGAVSMRLKPGTQNSQTYRLRGKGVPSIRGGSTGDQLVHVEIDVPTNLTQRQKELIEALGSELGTEVQIPSHSILEKIKHLFD